MTVKGSVSHENKDMNMVNSRKHMYHTHTTLLRGRENFEEMRSIGNGKHNTVKI